MVTRRQAILALCLLWGRSLRAQPTMPPPGFTTIDLGQWRGLAVTYKGEWFAIAPDEIWAALKEV